MSITGYYYTNGKVVKKEPFAFPSDSSLDELHRNFDASGYDALELVPKDRRQTIHIWLRSSFPNESKLFACLRVARNWNSIKKRYPGLWLDEIKDHEHHHHHQLGLPSTSLQSTYQGVTDSTHIVVHIK